MRPVIDPTLQQQAVANLIIEFAPDRWTLHSRTFLCQARMIMLQWDATGPLFEIYVGRRTTYASVQKAYPDLPESPVAVAS